MLRVTSWALSGLNVLGPDGAPRVKFKIRPKSTVFQVSNLKIRERKPGTKTETRGPETRGYPSRT
jgi:hypothetical protein